MTPSLNVEQMSSERLGEFLQVAWTAFPFRPFDEEEYRRDLVVRFGGKTEDCYLFLEGTEPIGCVQLIPFQQHIGTKVLPMCGVGWVGVKPEARRKGVATEMMEWSLSHMAQHGFATSFLYPFSHEYYARFGYRWINELWSYAFAPTNIREHDLEFRTYALKMPEHVEMLNNIYNNQWGDIHCAAARDPEHWQRLHDLIMENRRHVAYLLQLAEEPRPCAYLYAGYQEIPNRPAHQVRIAEACWLHPVGLRAIMEFLRRQAANVTTVSWRAPAGTHLEQFFKEAQSAEGADGQPGWGHYVVGTGAMGRIVDLKAVLEALPWRADLAFNLSCGDRHLPANTQEISVTLEHGTARLGSPSRGLSTLSGDIGPLSQVLLGAVSLRRAVHSGLVTVSDPTFPAAFDACLALPTPKLLDHF